MRRGKSETEILDLLAEHAAGQFIAGHTKSLRQLHGYHPTPKVNVNQHVPRLVLGTGVCPHCGGKSVRQNAAGDYWCYVCGWWQWAQRNDRARR